MPPFPEADLKIAPRDAATGTPLVPSAAGGYMAKYAINIDPSDDEEAVPVASASKKPPKTRRRSDNAGTKKKGPAKGTAKGQGREKKTHHEYEDAPALGPLKGIALPAPDPNFVVAPTWDTKAGKWVPLRLRLPDGIEVPAARYFQRKVDFGRYREVACRTLQKIFRGTSGRSTRTLAEASLQTPTSPSRP